MDVQMSEAAASVEAIDPLLSLLGGALGASLLTLIGGMIGAWIQSVRDHRRWLREKRFEAYFDFMIDMSRLTDLITAIHAKPKKDNAEALEKRLDALQERIDRSTEAVSILGPKKVNAAGQDWVGAANRVADDPSDANKKAVRKGRWKFLVAVGRVIRSQNVGAEPPKARPL